MVKEITIVIQPYPTDGYFYNGSSVTGEVVVKTGSNKSYYSKLQLTLVVTVAADFTDRDSKIRCIRSDETVLVTATAWERTDESMKFPKGVSRHPFCVIIPRSCYPSCENSQITVKYSLTASVVKDKRGKNDTSTSIPLKIYPPVNVSAPHLQGEETAHNVTPFSSFMCFGGGNIETVVALQHKGYGLDETLEVDIQIENNTRKRITHFDAALMQTIVCSGKPRSRFRSQNVLLYGEQTTQITDRATGNSVLPRSSWGEKALLRIPSPAPPTFTSPDSILTIQYHILVRVHTSRNARNSITLTCPITIGNCTNSDNFQDATLANDEDGLVSDFSELGQNPPSYFDIIQTDDSPVVPSAPSLPRDEPGIQF